AGDDGTSDRSHGASDGIVVNTADCRSGLIGNDRATGEIQKAREIVNTAAACGLIGGDRAVDQPHRAVVGEAAADAEKGDEIRGYGTVAQQERAACVIPNAAAAA